MLFLLFYIQVSNFLAFLWFVVTGAYADRSETDSLSAVNESAGPAKSMRDQIWEQKRAARLETHTNSIPAAYSGPAVLPPNGGGALSRISEQDENQNDANTMEEYYAAIGGRSGSPRHVAPSSSITHVPSSQPSQTQPRPGGAELRELQEKIRHQQLQQEQQQSHFQQQVYLLYV